MVTRKIIVYIHPKTRSENAAVYFVEGSKIYFSGLNSDGWTTTNAAEEIIRLIVERERIAHSDFQFYDLETHRGHTTQKIGTFVLNKLVLASGRIKVEEWKPVNFQDLTEFTEEISAEVFKSFHYYIN